MRYMGSKGRYSKYIVPILLNGHLEDSWYFEPFLGGGNLFSEVPIKKKFGSDTNKYSVGLLKAISEGWVPPDVISEEEYFKVKSNPDIYPDYYVGFLAYCCSYAGKFWGGYARGVDSKGKPRNYAKEQVKNLLKQKKGLIGATLAVEDYTELRIPPYSTVYCDPPYYGTTKYGSNFNHDYFWEWCYHLYWTGCRVFVSEYSAPYPPDWYVVWEKDVKSSLDKDTGSKSAVERLWTIK
jgi:DNA adenine methylase